MVNNHDQFPYFKSDFSAYPNREQQLHFIRAYIEATNDKTENEEEFLIEANYFALASHFFWSIWAFCRHLTPSSSSQFSYLDYALTRIDFYFKQKEKIFEKNIF